MNNIDAYCKNNIIEKNENNEDEESLIDFNLFRKLEDKLNKKFCEDCKQNNMDPRLYLNRILKENNKDTLSMYGLSNI